MAVLLFARHFYMLKTLIHHNTIVNLWSYKRLTSSVRGRRNTKQLLVHLLANGVMAFNRGQQTDDRLHTRPRCAFNLISNLILSISIAIQNCCTILEHIQLIQNQVLLIVVIELSLSRFEKDQICFPIQLF